MEKKLNGFKVFCVANGIKQKILCEKADVGITSMHYLQNEGKASSKTVSKVVESLNRDFGINITIEELEQVIQN